MTEVRATSPASAPVQADMCQCGHEKYWVDCWNCGGDVYVDHDCGEDTCCCRYPEDNVVCDICNGRGGFKVCIRCHPEAFDG